LSCQLIWTAFQVESTEHFKYPEPECNAVNPDEKTTQLPRKSSTGPSTQEQPQHPKSSSSDATRVQKASPAVSGRPTSLQIIDEQNPKFSAPHSSSEREVTKLELERRLSVSLSERGHRIAQLTDELALNSAILEQAEANAVETARRAGSELREYMDGQRLVWTSMVKQRDAELVDIQARLARDMQAKFDEMLLSRDQQIGRHEGELASVRAKLEATQANESEFRLRLADAEKGWTSLNELAVSRDLQVGQLEKELTDMRAKLDAKESELEAVRSRLTDAEMVLIKSKAEADTLRAKNATGSMNIDDDQVIRGLMERMRAIEAEVASKRWNVKSIEEMECRNEGGCRCFH
jgi:chromosome segregation ATPase